METNYENETKNYQFQLEDGLKYQDFLVKELAKHGLIIQTFSSREYQYTVGESHSKIEIKYDKQLAITKNLWIEYKERKHSTGVYVDSGILRNDNSFLWAQGDYNTLYIFCKRELLHKLQEEPFKENRTKTSIGKLLRYPLTERYSSIKFRFNDKALKDYEVTDNRFKNIFKPIDPIQRKETGLDKFGI